jgi:hypothetical protein
MQVPRTRDAHVAQWRRTVALANQWVRKIEPIAARLRVPGGGSNDWQCWYSDIARDFPFVGNRQQPLEYLSIIDVMLPDELWIFGDPWIPAIATRNTRHFLQGDLALVAHTNGTDRNVVWSSTGKGHRLCGYYLDTNRCGRKNELELVRLPGELAGRQLADPDPEMYLVAYAQDRSAPG